MKLHHSQVQIQFQIVPWCHTNSVLLLEASYYKYSFFKYSTATVNRANVSLQKSVDLQTATLNDILTYTVNVTNNGNVAANNVIFVDSIPVGIMFVTNSVTVNGVARPGAETSE